MSRRSGAVFAIRYLLSLLELMMELTLLIDLDDTLISSRNEAFISAYLKALGHHLANTFPPDKLIRELLSATDHMIRNQDPAQTLEQTFDQAFYPALGMSRADLQPALDDFYSRVYPSLQANMVRHDQAIRFVTRALSKGFRVAIATNPLFPRTAIVQRLEWAGLPPDRIPFSLISSYETFHFAKPNPAFYAEVMAQLGWPEGPAIMVGNDLYEDIVPASVLGLGTFWMTTDRLEPPESSQRANHYGDLFDLNTWLDTIDPQAFRLESQTPQALLAVLASTPAALDTLTRTLDKETWAWQPAPAEWSLAEIACHLRDVETEVNLPRLERMLTEPDPFLSAMDTDRWAQERLYICQDGPSALRAFVEQRKRLLDRLRGLDEQGWERPARHAIFGPTALRELVSFIASHDRAHVQQVVSNLRKARRRVET